MSFIRKARKAWEKRKAKQDQEKISKRKEEQVTATVKNFFEGYIQAKQQAKNSSNESKEVSAIRHNLSLYLDSLIGDELENAFKIYFEFKNFNGRLFEVAARILEPNDFIKLIKRVDSNSLPRTALVDIIPFQSPDAYHALSSKLKRELNSHFKVDEEELAYTIDIVLRSGSKNKGDKEIFLDRIIMVCNSQDLMSTLSMRPRDLIFYLHNENTATPFIERIIASQNFNINKMLIDKLTFSELATLYGLNDRLRDSVTINKLIDKNNKLTVNEKNYLKMCCSACLAIMHSTSTDSDYSKPFMHLVKQCLNKNSEFQMNDEQVHLIEKILSDLVPLLQDTRGQLSDEDISYLHSLLGMHYRSQYRVLEPALQYFEPRKERVWEEKENRWIEKEIAHKEKKESVAADEKKAVANEERMDSIIRNWLAIRTPSGIDANLNMEIATFLLTLSEPADEKRTDEHRQVLGKFNIDPAGCKIRALLHLRQAADDGLAEAETMLINLLRTPLEMAGRTPASYVGSTMFAPQHRSDFSRRLEELFELRLKDFFLYTIRPIIAKLSELSVSNPELKEISDSVNKYFQNKKTIAKTEITFLMNKLLEASDLTSTADQLIHQYNAPYSMIFLEYQEITKEKSKHLISSNKINELNTCLLGLQTLVVDAENYCKAALVVHSPLLKSKLKDQDEEVVKEAEAEIQKAKDDMKKLGVKLDGALLLGSRPEGSGSLISAIREGNGKLKAAIDNFNKHRSFANSQELAKIMDKTLKNVEAIYNKVEPEAKSAERRARPSFLQKLDRMQVLINDIKMNYPEAQEVKTKSQASVPLSTPKVGGAPSG